MQRFDVTTGYVLMHLMYVFYSNAVRHNRNRVSRYIIGLLT